MEVIIVARSIGRRTPSDALSTDGHAALIFNLSHNGANDHWMVQGGPSHGFLLGGAGHCSALGWFADFSRSQVNWSGPPQFIHLPVVVLSRFNMPDKSTSQLRRTAAAINNRHLIYSYTSGPNSNTYVHLFLRLLGHATIPVPSCPAPLSGILKGWSWIG